ncbi:ribosome maturation factor RimM [Echinicola vietnamensis]|uniref:Ribosome maturation factor RimM n=1 Tax=Echinicola vietnamensis (strain DSM 17526 / LMG 23754 / KMM 6221) TaxID=926556 RepID=L0FY99_ECHVK|nr:ribosome maturation factor RimM [Echinicola vietnamensis]AGA77610.1 16S rRNA processing protein RimM [Echinicola vietnamensis DSM 17526]
MNKDNCFQLGYIAKVHGLQGEVVAVLDVDYPENYEDIEHVFLEKNNRLAPYFLEHFVSQPNNRFLAKFEGYDDKNAADTLVGTALYLPLKDLPALEDDQYYYHELVGFEVEDASKGVLGSVKEIYDLQTQYLLGLDYQGKEILIPIQDDIILKVDKAAKKVFCQLPDGLLEIYLED